MTMKICLGRRDKVGRGDLWGIGEWGIGEKWRNTRDFVIGYLIRIRNSRKLLRVVFFGMIQIHFLPQGEVISVMFLHGFDNFFDVPR